MDSPIELFLVLLVTAISLILYIAKELQKARSVLDQIGKITEVKTKREKRND